MQSGFFQPKLRVLVACEFSGIVRDSFLAQGHNAVSIDIQPTEVPGPHIQDSVEPYLDEGWDLMIAHPPCTYLCNAGAQYHKGYENLTERALAFVQLLMDAPIPYIAIENPVGLISTRIRKPDQIIYPWQFGNPTKKRTCLWLKSLPPLKETDRVPVRERRDSVLNVKPWERNNRQKARNRFFKEVAEAMAEQWGDYVWDSLEAAYWNNK